MDDGATAEFQLEVDGPTTISSDRSRIVIFGAGESGDGLDTDSLTIEDGARLNLNSQNAVGRAVAQINGRLHLAGGAINGNGLIQLEGRLDNSGTITARHWGSGPQSTTLQITRRGNNARVDLDGPFIGGSDNQQELGEISDHRLCRWSLICS